VRAACFAETAHQHVVPGLEIENEKMKGVLSKLADQPLESVQTLSRTNINHERSVLDFSAGDIDSLHQFGDERHREVVDAEKTQIFKGFQNGSLARTAHARHNNEVP
jgi:hypothetical protein